MSGADPQAAAPSPAPRAKVRCKREVETGSLARVKKTCHTEAEWEAIGRDARAFGATLQSPAYAPAGRPGG